MSCPENLSGFPENEFMSWATSKQSSIENAVDQAAVLVAAMPSTITDVAQVEQSAEDEEGIPLLVSAPDGPAQVVSGMADDAGTKRLREMLLDPTTFQAK